MLNLLRPHVPDGSHPIETTRYILSTPSISRLLEAVRQWVDNRVPGAVIFGQPRFGKTRAIYYVSQNLPMLFGEKLPIMTLPCREYKISSENSFFQDLLRSSGHAMSSNGSASAKRDRLIEYLYEKAECSGQNRLIMFADEAQRLHEAHYNWLMDVYNELDAKGIHMTVLLVGQKELLHQRSAFVNTEKAQIVGRFMVHQFPFRGLLSSSDIKICLSGYDSQSEHPLDSGLSFTNYYFPAAFSLGWRLENHSDDVWDAFQQVQSEAALAGSLEIPMQYFSRTVEYSLRRYSTLDDESPKISINMWKDAIKNSGFIDAGRYVLTATES